MIKKNKSYFKNCAIMSALLLTCGLIPTNVFASELNKEKSTLEENANNECAATSEIGDFSTFSEASKFDAALSNTNDKTSNNEETNEIAIGEAEMTQTQNASTANITYEVSGTPTKNKEITINVKVSNVSNLYGASVDFKYDTSLLKINSVSQGGIFAGRITKPIVSTIKDGQVHLAMSLSGSVASLSGNGTIATIKATVLKAGTVNLTTTKKYEDLSSSLTTCVKLSNSTGNAIGYTPNNKSFSLTEDKITSYEENNSLIKYSGSWINDSNSSNSGKSAKYSASTGSSFTFSFNGTGFAWYGFTNPSKGIANIYIDGKKVQQDTYSATGKYQSLFYENRSLTSGKHTAKIEVSGTKSSKALNTYINVDKIDIFNGSMISNDTVTSYEENNSLIKYSGSWINDSNSSNSGKSAKYSASTGSSFTFSFNGTGFAWYGFTNPSKGIANIYIDGKKVQQDTYSVTGKYQSLFYENRSLTSGKHTVKIEVSGTKSSKALNTYINVDKIDIFNGSMISTNNTVASYEENNSLIKYSGSWINDSNSSNSGKSAKYSGSTGSSFTFSFNGTGFAWYGFTNPSKGIANIYIDGKKVQQDTYSATGKYQSLFYENRSLTSGKHTVKIEVSGTKSSKALNTYINVDKIDIFNGSMISTNNTVASYEENNSLIKYSGSWINDSNSSNSGKSAKYSGSTGSSFTFSFNGTGFAWYGFTNPSKGIANIYIDGKKVQQDTYSATGKYQSLFYENRSLTSGKHTVKIEVSGTKSSKALNTYINVDKIDIFNGSMISTNNTVASYEENNSLIKYSGSWINDSNSSNSGKSAKYSGSTGSSFTFSFNGTGFAWYGFTNPSKGIANIYIDGKKVQQDTYSATGKYQSLFYENRSLTSGKHTVKIEVSGTKSSKALNTYINVDKIDIFNGSMVSVKD